MPQPPAAPGLRRVVLRVGLLNLGYFGVEFAVALAIGSVALFADSIDFLEDASVNFLIFATLGWSAARRARVGMALALILLAPGIAALWTAWDKFLQPVPPAPVPLTLAGLGALAVNLACALMLARHRSAGGSLTRAAFLSARNDAAANLAIIAAGLVTALLWASAWPDLIVGLGIALLNAGAARDVWQAARQERRAATRDPADPARETVRCGEAGAPLGMPRPTRKEDRMAEIRDPENTIIMELKDGGRVVVELLADVAPKHAARMKELARSGAYDNVAFHRVIEGFMAQTGDVAHGNMEKNFNLSRAGTGGSDLPDLPAEFSKLPHDRGTLGAARSQNPNSANSQFFINFKDNHFLNNQYTVYGRVIEGMEHVDKIARGEPPANPDRIVSMKVAADVR